MRNFLQEESLPDDEHGRFLNGKLAEYYVPVNVYIGTIDATALDFPDRKFNPLGARGIGQLGITRDVAAVGNAILRATGKIIRNLPITLDKLIQPRDLGSKSGFLMPLIFILVILVVLAGGRRDSVDPGVGYRVTKVQRCPFDYHSLSSLRQGAAADSG